MNFRKTTIYFSAFILFIILFDAYQQQYYLTNYDILEGGASIPFLDLFRLHFYRWCIWGICSIPLAIVSSRIFSESNSKVSTSSWIQVLVVGLCLWLASVSSISILSVVMHNEPLNWTSFLSSFEFFVAQKGITFLFASCVLILTIYNNAKNVVIDAQWLEIKELSTTTTKEEQKFEPQVSIKIGNRVKLIPLTEVTWVESDDYCVKIHTEQKAYSLRKSLKSLEKQLAPYHFIRVHRGALLNLGYLDHVDFEYSMIKLQDSSELPLSKSGAQVLRKALKASSI